MAGTLAQILCQGGPGHLCGAVAGGGHQQDHGQSPRGLGDIHT